MNCSACADKGNLRRLQARPYAHASLLYTVHACMNNVQVCARMYATVENRVSKVDATEEARILLFLPVRHCRLPFYPFAASSSPSLFSAFLFLHSFTFLLLSSLFF